MKISDLITPEQRAAVAAQYGEKIANGKALINAAIYPEDVQHLLKGKNGILDLGFGGPMIDLASGRLQLCGVSSFNFAKEGFSSLTGFDRYYVNGNTTYDMWTEIGQTKILESIDKLYAVQTKTPGAGGDITHSNNEGLVYSIGEATLHIGPGQGNVMTAKFPKNNDLVICAKLIHYLQPAQINNLLCYKAYDALNPGGIVWLVYLRNKVSFDWLSNKIKGKFRIVNDSVNIDNKQISMYLEKI